MQALLQGFCVSVIRYQYVILMKEQGHLHWMAISLEQENNKIFE